MRILGAKKASAGHRSLFFVLGLGVGCILVGLWLYLIDPSELLGYLRKLETRWLIALTPVFFSRYFMRGWRWQVIVRLVEPLSIAKAYHICMVGYFLNYLIPIRAGDVSRSILLKRDKGTPISLSLPTVLADKLADFLPIVLILIMIPLLNIHLGGRTLRLLQLIFGVLLVLLIAIDLALVKGDYAINLFHRSAFWMPRQLRERIAAFLGLFLKGLQVLKRVPKQALAIIAITSAIVLLDALLPWLFFRAFGQDVPFMTVLFGITFRTLLFAIPAPPAQLGSAELIWVMIFAGIFGLDRNMVSAVVVAVHAVTVVLTCVLGIVSMISLSMRLTDVYGNTKSNQR